MLTTTNNARFKFLRKALVLPVTFAAVFALSCSTTETLPPTKANENKKPPTNVLYVVNGKIISTEDAKKIKGEQVAVINVLKDKAGTEKWGKAGANGVIEIILKEVK